MTMKLPENDALMLTAMLLTLSAIRRSSRIAGATFNVVCAKEPKKLRRQGQSPGRAYCRQDTEGRV